MREPAAASATATATASAVASALASAPATATATAAASATAPPAAVIRQGCIMISKYEIQDYRDSLGEAFLIFKGEELKKGKKTISLDYFYACGHGFLDEVGNGSGGGYAYGCGDIYGPEGFGDGDAQGQGDTYGGGRYIEGLGKGNALGCDGRYGF
jgi:hypothetical protein